MGLHTELQNQKMPAQISQSLEPNLNFRIETTITIKGHPYNTIHCGGNRNTIKRLWTSDWNKERDAEGSTRGYRVQETEATR